MKEIKYLNQLVPQDFICGPPILVQKKNKTVTLKKDYLCDLFHYIHDSYFKLYDEKNENDIPIPLSSTVLKKKYGEFYSYYIKYLSEVEPYIRVIGNHNKGRNCTIYKFLYWKVETNEMIIYQNRNTKMVSNYKELLSSSLESSIYPKRLINSIKRNLQFITIEKEEAIDYLKIQYPNQNESKYFKNYMSILNIEEKNSYLISDEYGRIHTFFTVLKKEIRSQFLRIEGEPIREVDIKNSQAVFLLYVLSKNLDKRIVQKELALFQDDVFGNKLYNKMAAYYGIIRDDAKPIFYKFLFGHTNGKDEAFDKFYPTIRKFIRRYKVQVGNYKLLSHELQKLEGNFIFNGICKDLSKQRIKYFTVHDSICVKASDYDLMAKIFENKLNALKQEIKNNIQNYYSGLN